jgi:hypothetical protein
MAAGYRDEYPKTGLLLSAAPGLLPEDARAAAVIERELERVDAGDPEAIDRMISYVWPIITESELRFLDGNR